MAANLNNTVMAPTVSLELSETPEETQTISKRKADHQAEEVSTSLAPTKKSKVVEVNGEALMLDSSTSNSGLLTVQGPEVTSLQCEAVEPNPLQIPANPAPVHVSRPGGPRGLKSKLPCGVGDEADERWSEVFIPTFLTYVGALPDAWKLKGAPAVKALQLIWDRVYHDKPYNIQGLKDPVFLTARQKTYEWRNKFSSVAKLLVRHKLKAFDKSEDKQSDIREFINHLLGKSYPFVYKSPTAELKQPFQSDFIAICFSAHLQSIKCAVSIPELTAMSGAHPVAALTLATLACYRALNVYASGAPITKGSFRSIICVIELCSSCAASMGWAPEPGGRS